MLAAHAGMAELIVSLPLGRIGKNLVGFGAFLELDLRLGRGPALIAIRMILHREASERLISRHPSSARRDLGDRAPLPQSFQANRQAEFPAASLASD